MNVGRHARQLAIASTQYALCNVLPSVNVPLTYPFFTTTIVSRYETARTNVLSALVAGFGTTVLQCLDAFEHVTDQTDHRVQKCVHNDVLVVRF